VGYGLPITGLIAWCYPVYIRDVFVNHFLMRKEAVRAMRLIMLGLTTFLAACQNGVTTGSRAEITDPNTAFSQGGAHTNTSNVPASGVSPRKSGLFQGSDADSQGR
jgi:hypothetical protein